MSNVTVVVNLLGFIEHGKSVKWPLVRSLSQSLNATDVTLMFKFSNSDTDSLRLTTLYVSLPLFPSFSPSLLSSRASPPSPSSSVNETLQRRRPIARTTSHRQSQLFHLLEKPPPPRDTYSCCCCFDNFFCNCCFGDSKEESESLPTNKVIKPNKEDKIK